MISMILALALANPSSLTNAQTAEIQKVEKRLLAPCCYTQSIAEHGSDVSVQMRTEVTEMVSDGKSEAEIIDHYRSIYGDRILIVPDGLTGRILFGLPVAISVLASLILFVYLRKMLHSRKHTRIAAPVPPVHLLSDSVKEKIERELGEGL